MFVFVGVAFGSSELQGISVVVLEVRDGISEGSFPPPWSGRVLLTESAKFVRRKGANKVIFHH